MAEIPERLRQLLDRIDGLMERDYESIGVLIRVGEWKIALEDLCTQIYEFDVELDASARAEITQLGELLDVATGYLLGDPWADRPSDS